MRIRNKTVGPLNMIFVIIKALYERLMGIALNLMTVQTNVSVEMENILRMQDSVNALI